MTQSDEAKRAAIEYVNQEYWGDDKRLVMVRNPEYERAFLAGVEWERTLRHRKGYGPTITKPLTFAESPESPNPTSGQHDEAGKPEDGEIKK